MPYVQPTAETFKVRYPEFVGVSDALISLEINDAVMSVGETWLERDRAKAQMLLVAHTLTLAGEPGRTNTGLSSAGTGAVKRFKVGDVETEFATPTAGAGQGSLSTYGLTAYGQQFAALLRLNFPSPWVV